jgi:DnaJ-class molecular chaperone
MSAKAFALLGLEPGAAPAEIQAAFKRLALTAHPDQGGTTDQFLALKVAQQTCLIYAKSQPCETCHGTGKVTKVRGWAAAEMTCSACWGTGRVHQ